MEMLIKFQSTHPHGVRPKIVKKLVQRSDAEIALEKALRERNDSQKRLNELMKDYDYLLVNETVRECAQALHCLICAEHRKLNRNLAAINQFRQELRTCQESS